MWRVPVVINVCVDDVNGDFLSSLDSSNIVAKWMIGQERQTEIDFSPQTSWITRKCVEIITWACIISLRSNWLIIIVSTIFIYWFLQSHCEPVARLLLLISIETIGPDRKRLHVRFIQMSIKSEDITRQASEIHVVRSGCATYLPFAATCFEFHTLAHQAVTLVSGEWMNFFAIAAPHLQQHHQHWVEPARICC